MFLLLWNPKLPRGADFIFSIYEIKAQQTCIFEILRNNILLLTQFWSINCCFRHCKWWRSNYYEPIEYTFPLQIMKKNNNSETVSTYNKRWRNGEVGRGFEPRSSQTKDYQIGSYCFSAKHAAIRSIHGLLFQWVSTIKIQLSVNVGLVQSVHHTHPIKM